MTVSNNTNTGHIRMSTTSNDTLHEHDLAPAAVEKQRIASDQRHTLMAILAGWLAAIAVVSALAQFEGVTGEMMEGLPDTGGEVINQ
jgi:hypothetical protein